MLSIANVKNGRQAEFYFTKKEDYYLSRDANDASQWWGRGADTLGLSGKVESDAFRDICEGKLPDGSEIRSNGRKNRRIATDLTFSAPKSLSIQALVRGDDDLVAAHEAAVTEALRYLEANAVNTRIYENSTMRREATDNLVVARFQHHTSRNHDPQLHTHCLAMNATQGQDGKWRAMMNDDFYTHKMTAGAVYRSELAQRVRALGYEIRVTRSDGLFELGGYSDTALELFSTRRKEILEALKDERAQEMRARGKTAAEVAAKANLKTRQAKVDLEPQQLRDTWRETAQSVNLGEIPKQQPQQRTHEETRELAKEALDWAIEHIEERRAVYEERDVLRHATARGLELGVGFRDIQQAIHWAQVDQELFAVGQHRSGQQRFTSAAMLELEQDILTSMKRGRGTFEPMGDAREVQQTLNSRGLKPGQQQAAEMILTNKDFVVGVQGYAGTGKTFMLRTVRELAEARGYTVKGMSVSAAATKELEDGAGIASQTVASHVNSRKQSKRGGSEKEIWVVDEASFLSSKDTHKLLKKAEREGARIVFVGDKDQLPAVEAGQPFAQLSKRGMRVAEMKDIVRQKNENLRVAVYATIDRKHNKPLELLDKNIHEEPNAAKRLAQVAQEFLRYKQGEAIVVTGGNADRRALNDLIRNGLKQSGKLQGDGAECSVYVQQDRTKAELRRSSTYKSGDVVRMNRRGGYRSLGVREGEYLTVTGVDQKGRVIATREDGKEVRWSPTRLNRVEVHRAELRELKVGDHIRWTRNDHQNGRINGEKCTIVDVDAQRRLATVRDKEGNTETLRLDREKHWEYGYASTVHVAQGATADRVIAHINTERRMLIGHESWYVAISRARHDANIFTDSKNHLGVAITRSMAQESAVEQREIKPVEQRRGWEWGVYAR